MLDLLQIRGIDLPQRTIDTICWLLAGYHILMKEASMDIRNIDKNMDELISWNIGDRQQLTDTTVSLLKEPLKKVSFDFLSFKL